MELKYIDLHSHLQFVDFENDREEVISKMKENNVIAINIGVDEKSSRDAIDLSKKYKGILWSTVGLHPLYTEQKYDIEDLLKDNDLKNYICGIGECGFDYFRVINEANLAEIKDFQKEIFINQIKMSKIWLLNYKTY